MYLAHTCCSQKGSVAWGLAFHNNFTTCFKKLHSVFIHVCELTVKSPRSRPTESAVRGQRRKEREKYIIFPFFSENQCLTSRFTLEQTVVKVG